MESPCKGRTSQRLREKIGINPSVSAIAIGKRVYPNQSMMKPYAYIISFVAGLNPCSSIFNKISDSGRDFNWVDSNVGFPNAISPRPFPNFVEHGSVHTSQIG